MESKVALLLIFGLCGLSLGVPSTIHRGPSHAGIKKVGRSGAPYRVPESRSLKVIDLTSSSKYEESSGVKLVDQTYLAKYGKAPRVPVSETKYRTIKSKEPTTEVRFASVPKSEPQLFAKYAVEPNLEVRSAPSAYKFIRKVEPEAKQYSFVKVAPRAQVSPKQYVYKVLV